MTLAGVTGTVEDFGLRRTTLRDLDGVVHTVPNGEIKVASNRTRGWARINLEVTVVYGTDIEEATAVVDAVGQAMLEDPRGRGGCSRRRMSRGCRRLSENGVTLKVLGTVRPGDQPAATGELRRLLRRSPPRASRSSASQRVVLVRDPQIDPPQPGSATMPPADPGSSWADLDSRAPSARDCSGGAGRRQGSCGAPARPARGRAHAPAADPRCAARRAHRARRRHRPR